VLYVQTTSTNYNTAVVELSTITFLIINFFFSALIPPPLIIMSHMCIHLQSSLQIKNSLAMMIKGEDRRITYHVSFRNRMYECGLESTGSEQGPLAGSLEYSNEPSASYFGLHFVQPFIPFPIHITRFLHFFHWFSFLLFPDVKHTLTQFGIFFHFSLCKQSNN
jgi:hypothetical protein